MQYTRQYGFWVFCVTKIHCRQVSCLSCFMNGILHDDFFFGHRDISQSSRTNPLFWDALVKCNSCHLPRVAERLRLETGKRLVRLSESAFEAFGAAETIELNIAVLLLIRNRMNVNPTLVCAAFTLRSIICLNEIWSSKTSTKSSPSTKIVRIAFPTAREFTTVPLKPCTR